MKPFAHRFCFALFVALVPHVALAQQARIDPAGIKGSVLLAGSHKLSDETCDKFVELAGGAKAKIVIIVEDDRRSEVFPLEQLTAAAKRKNAVEPVVVHLDKSADAIAGATGVWLHVESLNNWTIAMRKMSIAGACRKLIERAGVIGTAKDGILLAGGEFVGVTDDAALELIPDGWVRPAESKFTPRYRNPLSAKVSFIIDGDGVMVLKGRTITPMGPGKVHAAILRGKLPPYSFHIVDSKGALDLTALRRAARDQIAGFPPKVPDQPFVEKGTLVIVGGGGSPEGLYPKFVELAGGKGKANIVVFPTANADPLPKRDIVAQLFLKAGANKATVLYGRTQDEVESKEFLDTLKEATGLWFDGGRQWRFVDCYENTKALPLMFDVLQRGGVIGGTSAGATIQGDYLARGGVFNNLDIRYEGYERGLGFLKGVAIDQHFTQRKRQSDMTKLMKIHPQFLGIGIDEATAIVVQRSTAEVIGKGRVYFYDSKRKTANDQPDYEVLPAGGRYDLKDRKVLAK